MHDEERSGRPSIITDDLVEFVQECIMENHRFTITELSSHFLLLVAQNYHKVGYLLFRKLESALIFLQWYHDDGNKFLDQIITGDETWVAHITPETKQQSMHWHHSGSPCKTKFKQTLSAWKVMGQMEHSPHRLPDQRWDGEC